MLADLITSLFTRCSPCLRHMGYLDETLAMGKRSRKRSAAWQPHFERSKQFILTAAEQCRKRNKIVILGSGLLLDVPLQELSSLFREVVLMDVICLPEVRKHIRSFSNAIFVEHDVTGISDRLYRYKLQGRTELPGITPALSVHYDNASLIVSLNILSQLWVIPRAYAIHRPPLIDQEQLDDWCAVMVAAHYSFLRGLPCRACLIADHEFVKRDASGGMMGRGSTVYGLALPVPDAAWTWEIAPLGTESGFWSRELIVGAWENVGCGIE